MRLKFKDRCVIENSLKNGKNYNQIGKELGKHRCTIKREVERNSLSSNYCADSAHDLYLLRCKGKKPRKLDDIQLYQYVIKRLKFGWSPEQISGRLKTYFSSTFQISHETIYKFAYETYSSSFDLFPYFRRIDKKHKRYRGKPKRQTILKKGKKMIDKRPDIINNKERIGDWESDLIEGSKGSGYIATFVDRVSKYTKASKMETKHSEIFNQAANSIFRNIDSEKLYSITHDNGTEANEFEELEEILNCDIYFARPASPWQRGLNENTNGLLRQFFKKGSSFKNIKQKDIHKAERYLNHRPRKSLNFKSPYEVFFNKNTVALQN